MQRRNDSCIERLIIKEFGSFGFVILSPGNRISRDRTWSSWQPHPEPGNCWKIYINREFWEFQLGVSGPAPGLQAAAGWFESRETLKNGEFGSFSGEKNPGAPGGNLSTGYPQIFSGFT